MTTHDHLTRDAQKALWDSSYQLHAAPNLWGDPPVPFVADAVEAFIRAQPVVVADFPCGDGRNLAALAAACRFVVGMDASLNALQLAKQRADAQQLDNVLLLQADLHDGRAPSEQFDGVFCCDVLGHLREPHIALGETLRLCRPGGYIVANVFSDGDSTMGIDMTSLSDGEYLFRDEIYYRFYTEQAVAALLETTAAEIVSLKKVRWEEPPHEGFREYVHEHESWLFTLRKGS